MNDIYLIIIACVTPRIPYIIAAIVCSVFDILTGLTAAGMSHDWQSVKMKQGIWHKVSLLLIIMLGLSLDILCEFVPDMPITAPLTCAFCIYIMMMELISITENLCIMLDYQSERHCSKTMLCIVSRMYQLDYQSERHCSKTNQRCVLYRRMLDYQSERHCSKTGPWRYHAVLEVGLPVRTTLLQNSTAQAHRAEYRSRQPSRGMTQTPCTITT